MTLFEPGQLGEAASLAAALYCGLVIGGMYDVFWLLRAPFSSPWITGAIDLAFYAAAAFLAAAAMLYINCGIFRLYIYLAMGAGIWLYRRFPGRLIAAAVKKFTKKQLRRKL
ncbi:MAG: spore cortex biosynthesis protein YabQ [Clostridia bacterium]|nr:spore cortex biosynthesis protein YabQ [Clostridia bacterium]